MIYISSQAAKCQWDKRRWKQDLYFVSSRDDFAGPHLDTFEYQSHIRGTLFRKIFMQSTNDNRSSFIQFVDAEVHLIATRVKSRSFESDRFDESQMSTNPSRFDCEFDLHSFSRVVSREAAIDMNELAMSIVRISPLYLNGNSFINWLKVSVDCLNEFWLSG